MNVENNIPEGWEMTFLSEITNYISRGITPKYCENESVFVINQRCIRDNTVSLLNARFHDLSLKNVSDEKRLKFGDILICSTGVGTLGRVAQYKLNDTLATVDSHVTIVRPNDNIFKPFLGLFLSGKEREIEFLAEGTTGQTELPRTSVGLLSINLPPLSEQKAIAKVLTAFDDKIELLQAQNKTLETMAQTIFKEWFGKYQIGDELPEGWKEGKLGYLDFITFGDGNYSSKYPKQSDFIDNGIPFISNKDIKNGIIQPNGLRYISPELHSTLTKGHLEKWDIIMSTRANIGDIALVSSAFSGANINAQLIFIRSTRKEFYTPYLLQLFSSKLFRKTVENYSSGSAQSQLPMHALREIPILIPDEKTLLNFAQLWNKLTSKKEINQNQIQSLTKTRDTLLPKLMSGQVRVNNIKQTFDA